MLLGFPESSTQARALADRLDTPYGEITIHRFPDGEDRLTLPELLPGPVILYRSLNHPNDKLIELLLTSRALRASGAPHLTLVAPYLCYMRQDIAFRVGEVVSQRIIGQWLAELFDAVITVDPHLHRISRLEEALPARQTRSLTAGPLLADYLLQHHPTDRWLLLGPDSESEQWVSRIAQNSGLKFLIAHKTRQGDRSVEIELPIQGHLEGRGVVILDDMASTGETLRVAAEAAYRHGAREVRVLVTHALFTGDCLARLRAAGISQIGSSDSVPHPTNVVNLAPLLADAVQSLGDSSG